MGDCEAGTLVPVESTVKYHSGRSECLTLVRHPDQGQCLVGSLTGAVALRLVSLRGQQGAYLAICWDIRESDSTR